MKIILNIQLNENEKCSKIGKIGRVIPLPYFFTPQNPKICDEYGNLICEKSDP